MHVPLGTDEMSDSFLCCYSGTWQSNDGYPAVQQELSIKLPARYVSFSFCLNFIQQKPQSTTKMLFKSLCIAALGALATATYPIQLLYQYPPMPYTNIENVAVRSNGQLLLTIVTGARLVQLNPANPVPEDLITIVGPQSIIGIVEVAHDVFVVSAGNFSFGPQVPGGVAGVPGTGQVWSIDLNGPTAQAKLITKIPESGALNGVTRNLEDHESVLIADSGLGAVWNVNFKTGEYKTALAAPEFAPTPAFSLGINGIKTPDKGLLLYTNSAQGTYGGVYIDEEGAASGGIQVFASAPNGTTFDDFSVKNGAAYVAGPPNAVYRIPYGGAPELIAGGGDDQTLLGPTSTAFSKDGCTLYVTTGGAGGPMPVSGQVFAIDVCKYGKNWTA